MSVLRTIAQQIPGLVPGIFFFIAGLPAIAGASLELATDLFAEGDWVAAQTEARRVSLAGGPEQDRAVLLASVSVLRSGMGTDEVKASLAGLWRNEDVDLETRSMAAYELGLAEWAGGNTPQVYDALEFAYINARQPPLFWRAGCSLYFFLKGDKDLRKNKAVIWQSLQSCRDAWPLDVWQECRPAPKSGSSIGSLPGKWLVQFYRSQIGPAIGSRCDLLPSCSEYFKQASQAHGVLGIPIMADRFVREPSVVVLAEKPVVMPDGHIHYADPVSDHDSWLKR